MPGDNVGQEFSFQAEINRLLHLLSHSLYQSRDIAIRELISNASDALDKMRHVALTEPAHKEIGELAIRITPDPSAGILVIADNGIGMTQEELKSNLGTIAKSGSLEFLSQLTGDAKKDVNLIGQFGVGFYSSFMLADLVEVRTRSYRDAAGWIWKSDGTGSYTIAPAENLERGTQIVLHLKGDLKDFAIESKITQIVKQYSSFIPHPIRIGDKTINDVKPIWVEPKNQLTDAHYAGFYEHLTHHAGEKPLWHLHFSTDSPIQFHALIYCPPTNFERLGLGRFEHGLHLCAKRVLVQDDCRDLLPEYLRFLHGLVDSEDLPLNISREALQDNTVFQKIRRVLVKRLLDRLAELAKESPETFDTFYEQFGHALKEGVGTDFDHRQKLASLLRFPSTKTEAGRQTTLDEYVSRVGTDQKQIYYLGGPSLSSVAAHPHLEIFKKRGIEVLLLPEPIDEWAVSALGKYQDFELQSADAAQIDLPKGTEEAADIAKEEPDETGLGRVLSLFKNRLQDRVRDVRRTDRLVDSPCCLANADGTLSTQMQKIMMMTQKDFQLAPRILEINPRAKLIRRLCHLSANAQHDEFISRVGEQLYFSALLVDGMLTQPQELASRVQEFMEEAAQARSPIVT
jgi:molecular chaperone HtpG